MAEILSTINYKIAERKDFFNPSNFSDGSVKAFAKTLESDFLHLVRSLNDEQLAFEIVNEKFNYNQNFYLSGLHPDVIRQSLQRTVKTISSVNDLRAFVGTLLPSKYGQMTDELKVIYSSFTDGDFDSLTPTPGAKKGTKIDRTSILVNTSIQNLKDM